MEPALSSSTSAGAAAYHDARVDLPERLALENILDAEAHGATVLNYCEALSTESAERTRAPAVRRPRHARRARSRHQPPASSSTRPAHGVEQCRGGADRAAAGRVRTTKGDSHRLPAADGPGAGPVLEVDRRLMFAIPRGGPDVDRHNRHRLRRRSGAGASDRAPTSSIFSHRCATISGTRTPRTCCITTAGVRALVTQGGRASSVSRMHKVVEGEPLRRRSDFGAGGKDHRLSRDCRGGDRRRVQARRCCTRRCSTADMPLPGARNRRVRRARRRRVAGRASSVSMIAVREPRAGGAGADWIGWRISSVHCRPSTRTSPPRSSSACAPNTACESSDFIRRRTSARRIGGPGMGRRSARGGAHGGGAGLVAANRSPRNSTHTAARSMRPARSRRTV